MEAIIPKQQKNIAIINLWYDTAEFSLAVAAFLISRDLL